MLVCNEPEKVRERQRWTLTPSESTGAARTQQERAEIVTGEIACNLSFSRYD
jgi:hypothetical protein